MRLRAPILLAVPLLVLLASTAFAVTGTVTGSWEIDVPAGQWRAIRMLNVPARTVLSFEVEATGALDILILETDGYRRFPEGARPLFKGDADNRLSFSITAPSAGTYYLVLDNRPGQEARAVEVTLRGSRPSAGATSHAALERFKTDLQRIFVFQPFSIRAGRCGRPQAYATPTEIVLCTEYAEALYAKLADKAKVADALLFTLFHELGHVLLAQWKYPFYANEEIADEFATAAMIMLGQRHRVRAKAEFFAANPSVAEAIGKVYRDDPHPISAQRARNILKWLGDPALVRKWQPVFVPHMQTKLLEQLVRRPPAWADRALIEKELAARKETRG
ncbi:MAG: hypothetical protein HY615_06090 [Candidatus Rokubacteria bacterium]|nr:hypothetical protein [Candidatus Rokubacteria bacterium]